MMLTQPSRLRVLLIGVLLAAQLVTVTALLWSNQRDATEALRETAERTLERFAERVDESTRTYLEGAENVVSGGARLIDAGLLDTGDDEALRRYFAAKMSTYPWISSMAIGRADGDLVHISRDGDETASSLVDIGAERHMPTDDASTSEPEAASARRDLSGSHDARNQPWYRDARASDSPVWSAPDALPGEVAVTGVSVAVALERRADRLPGGIDADVLAITLDLQTLSSYLSSVPEAGAGSAMLVDASGRVVAYSDPERFAKASAGKNVPQLAELGDGLLERLLERYRTRVTTTEGGAIAREPPLLVDRRQHLALVRPFSPARATDAPWVLVAQVPFDRYTGVVQERFERRLAVLLAVLTLSALVAVLAVLRLTRPIYRIHRDATTDPLTGACNRTEFERRISARTRHARRSDESMVLVVFDLDGFKGINDTYGHAAGDAVLVAFVRRLTSRLRSSDIVARLGGDEFAVALDVHGTAADDVAVIEEIRADVAREAVVFADKHLVFGATAGIARKFREESVVATLARADRALVAGKAVAKNRTYAALAASDTSALVLGLSAVEGARLEAAAGILRSDERPKISV